MFCLMIDRMLSIMEESRLEGTLNIIRGGKAMLENWSKPQKPDEAELEERLKIARDKLSEQQMR